MTRLFRSAALMVPRAWRRQVATPPSGDPFACSGNAPTPTSTLFSALHPTTPVAPNVTRHVVDGSGSPTSYTRLTINPGRKKDLFTLTRVPLE